MSSDWMLYGAYGHAGVEIAAAAARRGHRPLLAGRNPARLGAVADRLSLQANPLTLDEPDRLAAAIRGRRLVVNAAGPFSETAAPLIEACLAEGVHYLDVSGEVHHIRRVLGLGARAKTAGVALLTGAGFGVTYGDVLARHVMRRLPGATRLRLSVAAENALTTAAVRRTILGVLAGGGFAVEGGLWTRRPLGHQLWEIRDVEATVPFAAAPMGELAALAAWTGARDIVVGRPMPAAAARRVRLLSPAIRTVMSIAPLRAALGRDRGPAPPAKPEPAAGWRSRLWAEAWNARGVHITARLETGEGGAATAAAAIANLEALLASPRAGAFTPGMVFDADHVRTIEGARIVDLGATSTPRELAHA
jgi:short subunit dehydrogenase-like uncharacterized protein